MSTIVVLVFGLMVWSASMAHGKIHLTVNGKPLDSITLELGQSCTVEVVSDDSTSYEDAVGFGNPDAPRPQIPRVLGDFSHLETRPEAGNSATVIKITDLYFYGYGVKAAGRGITPGVHFVFEYVAQQVGETDVKLYDSTFTNVIDSVHIAVIQPQHLRVNGQDVRSITLEQGQTCTVEVVSTVSTSYTDYVGFDNGVVLGSFSHYETTPLAGDMARVTEYNKPDFYGYYVVAAGFKPPPSAGVHFIFEYEALQVGETDVKLYDETLTSELDSVHVTVMTPAPMGTAFTYQGRLLDAGSPADGLYDFEFKLYRAPNGGIQEGNAIDINDVDVIDGQFAVELDFGSDVFAGDARWLQIGVRPGDSSGGFTTLSPRQEITPVPYALHASSSKVKQLIADFVVASGESVTAGDVVVFLNGYVQKGFAATGDRISCGSEYVFNPSYTGYMSAAALSSTKFVVACMDKGYYDYGIAVIGDVSGSSITYGSKYVFDLFTGAISVAALSSDKFVVSYRATGYYDYGVAVIGDVSGNTIAYGSTYIFNEATTDWTKVAALSSTKFVVAYRDYGNFDYGTAVIGDVSGDSITYGSEYVFNQAVTSHTSVAALSSNEFVVAYRDGGTSGTAVIGDVSGNTITYGSEYVFSSAGPYCISVAALSSAKFVVAYRVYGNFDYGTAVIGDVSGSSITYGSEYVFNPAPTGPYIGVAALSSTKFVVTYEDEEGYYDYGRAVIGDVSGNSITYGSENVFNEAFTGSISVAVLSSTKFVVAYRDEGNSDYGTACIGTLLAGNIVGIAKESATDGQTVPVIIDGVSDVHSGLIPGVVYYRDANGDLTTDQTVYRVGLAISSTEILLDR